MAMMARRLPVASTDLGGKKVPPISSKSLDFGIMRERTLAAIRGPSKATVSAYISKPVVGGLAGQRGKKSADQKARLFTLSRDELVRLTTLRELRNDTQVEKVSAAQLKHRSSQHLTAMLSAKFSHLRARVSASLSTEPDSRSLPTLKTAKRVSSLQPLEPISESQDANSSSEELGSGDFADILLDDSDYENDAIDEMWTYNGISELATQPPIDNTTPPSPRKRPLFRNGPKTRRAALSIDGVIQQAGDVAPGGLVSNALTAGGRTVSAPRGGRGMTEAREMRAVSARRANRVATARRLIKS